MMSNEVNLYAILSDKGEVIKTSHGLYYFTRTKAREARKEVEGKARIVKRSYNAKSTWVTAK
jgi:hypothetical protein